MQVSQAIDQLENIESAQIAVRSMSKDTFKFVRACARLAQNTYPGMAGYYDPEYTGPRAQPWKFLFRPATVSIPSRFQDALIAHIPDPYLNPFDL